MTAFLIVIAVLALLIIFILSLSATFTIVYDKGWHTKIKVLFIEKDIILSDLISFILFPDKKAKDVSDKRADKKSASKKAKEAKKNQSSAKISEDKALTQNVQSEETPVADDNLPTADKKTDNSAKPAPSKPNPIKKMWDEEGIVGILSFASNLMETASSAVLTLFRGLHIYSLYVMIIVGGPDADVIARSYGTLCKYYYPVKGMILNGMKVDNYDDYVQPDFIADKTEFEFQFIGSISVGLLLRSVLKAGIVFLKNFINNKKGDKKQ